MTKDYFKRATMKLYTEFDIDYASFPRGQERRLKKIAKRQARRIYKNSLNKYLDN